jgi:transposase InsO family protein
LFTVDSRGTVNTMTIHKRTRLTPIQRKELYDDYHTHQLRVCDLIRKYRVSAPTVYKILHRGRQRDFSVHKSVNARFRMIQYGLKRLTKVEVMLEKKLKAQAKRYNKQYPGEMIHVDTKRLPLLTGETRLQKYEYLFVGIDDFSRELYAAILPDKTQYSAEAFLKQALHECPYTIEQVYSDNGLEYRGSKDHAFMKLCTINHIEQRFTKVKTPQTNGKAERVIRTLMEMWHEKTRFKSRVHRKQELIRFVNWYNTVKPHKGINNHTPPRTAYQLFLSD